MGEGAMRFLIVCACLIVLSGCSSSFFSKFAITDSAAKPIVKGQEESVGIDLVSILDPKQYGRLDALEGLQNLDQRIGDPPKNKFFEKVRKELQNDPVGQAGLDRLENAFRGFYNADYGVSTQVRRRNSVRSRLLDASYNECEHFLDELRQEQAGFNFALGSLTSTLGGVGAIVTGAGVARAFSGAAAIVSGVRAEGNDANFRQLTAEVIARGIETRRSELLETINPRRNLPIESYTVEDAVADAVKYHSVCSLISGLQQASKQVQLSQDPGLRRTMTLLKKAGIKGDFTIDLDRVETDTLGAATPTNLLAAISDAEAIRGNARDTIRSIEQLLGDAGASVSRLRQRLSDKRIELANADGQQDKLRQIGGEIPPLDNDVASIAEFYRTASALNAEIINFAAQNEAANAAKKFVDLAGSAADAQRTFDKVSQKVDNLSSQLQKLVAPKETGTGGG